MKCPYCACADSKVIDKRDTKNDVETRRRRECQKCGKRYTTYERVDSVALTIRKKNGTREQYDRSKILKGLLKACEKRAISREEIEQIVDDVETELRNADDIEIPSKKIGTIVIKKLRKKDKVAYVRFASVYKEFEDPSEFEKEVSKLMKKKS